MDLELGGKTVLITGGSKGIGLAVAKGFAAEGCNLHLTSRTADDLRAALQLTGWFLTAHVFAGASVPPARERFLGRLTNSSP